MVGLEDRVIDIVGKIDQDKYIEEEKVIKGSSEEF